MADTAVHLEQSVLPRVPIRHWICSLPWGLRALLGYDRKLCAEVVSAFMGEVDRSLRWRAKRELDIASVPWGTLVISVVMFIVIPLAAGIATQRFLTRERVKELGQRLKPTSILGLLLTVVLLFGFQAETIIARPLLVVLIAVPLQKPQGQSGNRRNLRANRRRLDVRFSYAPPSRASRRQAEEALKSEIWS